MSIPNKRCIKAGSFYSEGREKHCDVLLDVDESHEGFVPSSDLCDRRQELTIRASCARALGPFSAHRIGL